MRKCFDNEFHDDSELSEEYFYFVAYSFGHNDKRMKSIMQITEVISH